MECCLICCINPRMTVINSNESRRAVLSCGFVYNIYKSHVILYKVVQVIQFVCLWVTIQMKGSKLGFMLFSRAR